VLDLGGPDQTEEFCERLIETVEFDPLGGHGMVFHVCHVFEDPYQVYQFADFTDFDFDFTGFSHGLCTGDPAGRPYPISNIAFPPVSLRHWQIP
jgi:hypothetical protein